jgi:hypothetical protein
MTQSLIDDVLCEMDIIVGPESNPDIYGWIEKPCKEDGQSMRTEQEQKNLKTVLDFYDVVINGQQYDRAHEFLDDNYIQHKPEVET